MLLKFELNKLGFEGKYEVINIEQEQSSKEKLVSAGFLSVPVVEIDGVLMNDLETIKQSISKIFV